MMESRRREARCISDLELDRLVGGELEPTEERVLLGHAGGCEACRARLEAIRADQRSFAEKQPPFVQPGPTGDGRRAMMLGLAPILAAAACLIMLFGRTAVLPVDAPLPLPTKGGKALEFYVLRHGEVSAGNEQMSLHPGDTVEFVFSSQRPGYLAILSVDGAGRANVYFPAGADRAAAFQEGLGQPVPVSTILDDTLGDERIYALQCDTAIVLEPIRAALAGSAEGPPPIAGCVTHTLRYRKEKP
jgi:hypothetical protein